jgi:hypothetical protein
MIISTVELVVGGDLLVILLGEGEEGAIKRITLGDIIVVDGMHKTVVSIAVVRVIMLRHVRIGASQLIIDINQMCILLLFSHGLAVLRIRSLITSSNEIKLYNRKTIYSYII